MQGGVVALAVMCAALPVDATRVERWFSTGLYPRVQHVVTTFSNLVPFALFDVLLVIGLCALVTTVVVAARRARASGEWRPLFVASRTLVVSTAVLYLAFLFLWGFNYRRVPMVDRLAVQAGTPSRDDVLQLGLQAAARLNSLHAPAHAAGWHGHEWQDDGLRDAFARVQRALSDAPPARVGRLKATLLGPYFRWTSVDGMVNPFALEVLANPGLLPFERPFLAAHEWAHLAGYAHEADANFVAWLTCLQGPVPAQYSGWLFLYWQVQAEGGARDRARLRAALDPGPRDDLGAISTRVRQGQVPALRRASWMAYDRYLRANRVDDGVRSYGAVLTLILRARFDDGWVPVRRAAAAEPPVQ
jgi:hypothetical protein